MKPFALIASAVLLASPAAFADMHTKDMDQDKNLCQLNLGEIDQYLTLASTVGEPAETRIRMYYEKAKEAQGAGNVKDCIAHSGKALEIIKSTGEGAAPGITD